METITYRAVYQKDPPYGGFRVFSECEFNYQKNGRNELQIGRFDGRDVFMRVPGMDFQNCEILALFLSIDSNNPYEAKEKEIQICVRFPDQRAMVNDYLYAALSAYLYHRGIRYESMEKHLCRYSPDKLGMRFERSGSAGQYICYTLEDLFRFSLDLVPRENRKDRKAREENAEDLP